MYITRMTHTPQSLRNLPIAAECGLVIAADCRGLWNYIIHQNKQQRTSWGVVGTRYMDKDSDRLWQHYRIRLLTTQSLAESSGRGQTGPVGMGGGVGLL